MKKHFRLLIKLLTIPLALLLIIGGAGVFIDITTSNLLHHEADLPADRPAVVFGTSVIQKTGELGEVLKTRMDAAIRLYKVKKVTALILSGDSVSANHDEVTPMTNYALEAGVAAKDITQDRKGTSTYDTCYRLHNTFKIQKAVLITNDFHLPRALYTCQALGVDVVGFGVANDADYTYSQYGREPLARVKTLIDLYIAPPHVPTD